MNRVCRISLLSVLGLALAGGAPYTKPAQPLEAQSTNESPCPTLLRCLTAKDFGVRLMYWPPENDLPHYPTIFRPVEPTDPRAQTWSRRVPEGTTIYVTPLEMKALGEGLAKLKLKWQESTRPLSFKPERAERGSPLRYRVPVPRGKGMQIDISCDGGSATTELPPERICIDMPSWDKLFAEAYARYRLQSIRWDAGCKVPGFDPKKIPGE